MPADQQRSYMLMHQFSRITRDRGALRHDDRLDALAMALGFHADAMARDRDREMAEIRAERHAKVLEEFLNPGAKGFTLGHRPRQSTWLS
jgi:hypothetical protein